ncbi:hypothetical protein D9M71_835300 [compost metagenome]
MNQLENFHRRALGLGEVDNTRLDHRLIVDIALVIGMGVIRLQHIGNILQTIAKAYCRPLRAKTEPENG